MTVIFRCIRGKRKRDHWSWSVFKQDFKSLPAGLEALRDLHPVTFQTIVVQLSAGVGPNVRLSLANLKVPDITLFFSLAEFSGGQRWYCRTKIPWGQKSVKLSAVSF